MYRETHSSTDDLIQKFWEMEESPTGKASLSLKERFVVKHFKTNYLRHKDGKFVVPFPRESDVKPSGESHSQ